MSGKRLFMGPTPHQFTQASEESATRMIRSFTEDQLRANSCEDLVQAVVDDKVPRAIVLDVEHHQIANGIVPSAPQGDEGWASVYRPASPFPDRAVIAGSLYVPYTGTRQAFDTQPNRMPVNLVEGSVTSQEVIMSVVVDPDTSPQVVEQRLLAQEQDLVQWVTEVNGDIAALEHYIRDLATRQIQGRLDVIKKRNDMAAAFSIPVREVERGTRAQRPGQAHRGSAQGGAGSRCLWGTRMATGSAHLRADDRDDHQVRACNGTTTPQRGAAPP
jgi:hypothetical protein